MAISKIRFRLFVTFELRVKGAGAWICAQLPLLMGELANATVLINRLPL